MPKCRRLLLAILCLVGLPTRVVAEEFQGKVVGVADGDTITVLLGSTPVKIRLQAVDCPEKAQPFGAKAKQFASEMVFGKVVTVKIATRDKYGRTVGWVYVGGKSLNEELLRVGLAWHYRQYDHSEKLAKLEQEARATKRGLWAEPTPTPPWEWRHRGEKAGHAAEQPLPKLNCYQACMRDSAAQAIGIEAIKANCTRRCSTGQAAAPVAGHPDSAATVPPRRVGHHGNVMSKVFHAVGCKDYNCKRCTAVFESQEEAVRAGYRAHATCIGATSSGSLPPSEPASETRACKTDKDCVFAPRGGCGCPPCGDTWRHAVNKKHAALLRGMATVGSCGRGNCARCDRRVRWLGTKAVCIQGQCEVR